MTCTTVGITETWTTGSFSLIMSYTDKRKSNLILNYFFLYGYKVLCDFIPSNKCVCSLMHIKTCKCTRCFYFEYDYDWDSVVFLHVEIQYRKRVCTY